MEHADLVQELLGPSRKKGAAPQRSTMEWVQALRRGLPFARAERVYRQLGFTLEEAATSLGVPARTLHRRKAGKARLDPSESEKILRLARVGAAAIDVFGDEARARQWLRTPLAALEGVVPVGLLDTDVGTQAVLDVLTRIEHGVYN